MSPSDARRPSQVRSWVVAIGLILTALTALLPVEARAQVLGTWQTAITEPEDAWRAGAFLILGEPIGLVGQLRTGLGSNWDLGIQGGFPDFTDDTIYGIAGDTKFLLHKDNSNFPLDVSGDVAFGYQTNGDFDLVDFDFGVIGSKKLTTDGGEVISPYGAIIIAVGHANDDTEVDVHVRPGLEWMMTSVTNLLVELNLSSRDETIAISAGFMFKL
jgi:hypothetical protein